MKTWKWALSGLFLLGLPAVVAAQFAYTTNNGSLTITGYTGTNGNVIIPATINGYPVTSIGGFYSSTSLTNLAIPGSVTNIASGALSYQSQLLAIVVDPQNAYYSSTNGILFDKPQTLLIQAPGGLAGSYAIPAGVTRIGDNAFNFCASLSGITIPASVTNLGSGAFADCQSLTGFSVDPQNLFYSSTNGLLLDKPQTTLLQAPGGLAGSPAIPAGVTSIGASAFSECTSVTSVTVPASVTNLGSGAFYFCSGLTNLTLGDNVTSIGDNAFDYCSGLTDFTLPGQVTSIGAGTFENCGGLTSLALGTNVTSIGDNAFYYCSGLTGFSIPDSVTNLGNAVFEHCSSLTNVSLGAGVSTIGSDAFAACPNLTSLSIPKSVTKIVSTGSGLVRLGSGTPPANGPIELVANCGRLTAITVDPQNLFYSSSNGILFNKSQTALLEAPGAFAGSYAVPGSVTSIGAEAFQNCANLTSVSIPGSVTNIGSAALADCGSLTAIAVDAQNLFYRSLNGVLFDATQTTLLQFPGGFGGSYAVSNAITSLGGSAFSGCSNLTRILIPISVTNVGNSTFTGCSYAGIYFAGNAPGITASGSLPGIRSLILLGNNFYNPNAEAVYYLPGTTGWGATFDGLPAYLWTPPYVCTPTSNSITINGFNGSGGSVTIPDMINGLPVTTIAGGVFDNANGPGLTNIILGAKVTSIGSYAFAACTSLTSITIPGSVTNIGSEAFAFCANLESVYFQGNAPSADASVFFRWSVFPIFPPVYEPPAPTTVYYLPGTTGWGTTFGGQPTVLWNPQAQTRDASFGVHANRFGFNVTGASNLVVVVESTPDLAHPDWQPVQTLTLTSGAAYFSDPQWTNHPGCYYRLRSP